MLMPYKNLADRRAQTKKRRENPEFLAAYKKYQNEYAKKRLAENPEEMRRRRNIAIKKWRRKKRGDKFGKRKKMPPEEFKVSKDIARKKYRSSAKGKANDKAYSKKWVSENRDRVRHNDLQRYKRDPQKRIISSIKIRAKRLGAFGEYSGTEFHYLVKSFGHRCCYCGIFLHEKNISADHKIPLSRGGTNTIENIVPACRPCNSKKNTRTFDEFWCLIIDQESLNN